MNKLAQGTYRGFSWYERAIDANHSVIAAISNTDFSEFVSGVYDTRKVNIVDAAHKWIDTILAGGY